jgi:imidazolonepropionase
LLDSYDLVLENVSQLVTCEPALFDSQDEGGAPIGLVDDGCLAVSGGRIEWVGRQRDFAARRGPATSVTIDARGCVVLPGLVDAHTHTVFAGTREREYELRIRGKSYMEIAGSGGGINSTVAAVRSASEDELVESGLRRIEEMLRWGTTTVEIKSGYGLSVEAELKMLRAIGRIARRADIDVVPTFLGAHEVPPEFAGRKERYVDLVVDEMIPAVGGAKLAEFCDVFCERGVFTPEESLRILRGAAAWGMRPKIHADEFAWSGGAEVAAEVGAISAEHLVCASREGLTAMKEAGTVAVLLPGVAVGTGKLEFASAREMLSLGLTVALATDFNPGSSMVHSLPIVSSLACSFMKMTPAEAIGAMTMGGARALGREGQVGSLALGKQADFGLYEVPDFRYIPYHLGGAVPKTVVKSGRVVYSRDSEEATR